MPAWKTGRLFFAGSYILEIENFSKEILFMISVILLFSSSICLLIAVYIRYVRTPSPQNSEIRGKVLRYEPAKKDSLQIPVVSFDAEGKRFIVQASPIRKKGSPQAGRYVTLLCCKTIDAGRASLWSVCLQDYTVNSHERILKRLEIFFLALGLAMIPAAFTMLIFEPPF